MGELYHATCSWVHQIASKDTSSRSQPYSSEGLYSIGSAFVLSTSIRLLPLLYIQCRGSPLMNTYPSILPRNILVFLSKTFTSSKALQQTANKTRKDAQRSWKKGALHMFYLFKIPRQFTQNFSDISLLASTLCRCRCRCRYHEEAFTFPTV